MPATRHLFRFIKAHRYLSMTTATALIVIAAPLSYLNFQHNRQLAAQLAVERTKQSDAKVITQQHDQTKTLHNAVQQSSTSTQAKSPAITAVPTSKSVVLSSVTKYHTSSDPRSTDYSTTPPAANPASFNTTITHANQVASGTVISYNATKGERIVYSGDLVIDRPTISYTLNPNLGATNNLRFNVSVPDDSAVNMPSLPYNTPASGFWISANSGVPATSFAMTLNPYSINMAPGTYVVHIVTNRSTEAADDYQYDGFITVIVTN